jgi:aminoglycoside phosphotransferase
MLQAIADKVGVDLSHDSDLHQLRQETQPEKLAQQIENREEK